MESKEYNVYAAMQAGTPYATYKKTTLGKVFVSVLDPFSGNPVGIILEGEKGDEKEMIDVWNETEDVFFKKMNRLQFDQGYIIPCIRESKETPKPLEQYSDTELKELLSMKYFAFQKLLSEITTTAVAQRLLDLAREMEKSEKITLAIETKLSELQQKS
jgi:hypothetical protein